MACNPQTWAWLVVLTICLPMHLSSGQEALFETPSELLRADATSCVFAGSRARFSYVGAAGPVEWTLVAANRTICQGKTEPAAAGPNDAPALVIAVSLPNLHAGVVLPAGLRLSWNVAGRELQRSQPVTIFSPDPFSVRRVALEQAHIALVDPTGETAETFERHDIPHSRLLSLSAISQIDEGVVIVGEGVSFREHTNLPETLLRAAERGVPVLCLAPIEGEFAFPQPDEATSGPLRVAFEQRDVVRRYDKRFDLLPTISRLAVEPHRDSVLMRASESAAGWSWFDVQYAAQDAEAPPCRLIICGMAMIRHWEASPVPRYLLVHLLEELTATQSAEKKEKDDLTQR